MEDIIYHGWTLHDKVTIVVRKDKRRYGYEQAYVVEAGNKKALESAKKWANKYMNESHKPEELTFENIGFEVELYGVAGHSSNGGKLSFWNCIFRKDGREFLIGVNSSLLLQFMLQSECKNGRFTESVSFARKDSNTGILHTGMKQYKQAVKDQETKKKISDLKTSKHEVGNSYVSLTKDNIYLGEMNLWFKCEKSQERRNFYMDDIYTFTVLDKPIKKYSFLSTYDIRKLDFNSIGSVGGLLDIFETNLDQYLKKNNDISHSGLVSSVKILGEREIVSKLPTRALGKIHIEAEGQEKIEKLINKVRESVLKLDKQPYPMYHTHFLECFGYSWRKDDKPNYTEEQRIKILSLFEDDVRIDFGDGIVHKGTYVRDKK